MVTMDTRTNFAPNFPRDASFTIKQRKMRALAAYRTSRILLEEPISTEGPKNGGLTAEQLLLTNIGECKCTCNSNATCTVD